MPSTLSKLHRSLLDSEEMLMITLLAYNLETKQKKKRRRKHRWWVHDILKNRHEAGAFAKLVPDLQADDEKFRQYFRMNQEQFSQVLSFVGADLAKHCRSREPICPKQRLAICLRFLATGESFRSLSFNFRVGPTTIAKIVDEVCQVIWDRMSPTFMSIPDEANDWKMIAENFLEAWNFPHCLGAIDGKHVVIKSPCNSGSLYYNYKNTFSIVLLALVDANLRFIAIDVGSYGRNSDAGIFAHSNLGKAVLGKTLNFPDASSLPNAEHLGPVPYVIIGDEAFPLQENIMRPYPGRGCTLEQHTFNYRLSRARRIVENAFGILACRWRIFHTPIADKSSKVNHIVKATCVLHNMLQESSTPAQITTLLHDVGDIQMDGLQDIDGVGNRAGADARYIRDAFKEYFSRVSPLAWQDAHVQRGVFA